jgi:membrane fusion protein, multidrug efflux system
VTTSTENQAGAAIGARRAAIEARSPLVMARRPWQQRVRLPLMVGGPLLVLLAVGYWYLTGGRYVSTDDAYVEAARVQISNDVSGRVVAMAVKNNERVKKGQVLFRLDPRPFQIAVERAKADLAGTRLKVEALKATYREKLADEMSAEATLSFMRRERGRQQQLLTRGAASQQQYDQAEHSYEVAQQQLEATKHDIANVLASLGGDPNIPVDKHPTVEAAQAALDTAELYLSYTVVRAPDDGIVTKVDQLQVGDWVQGVNTGAPPTTLFSLVSDHDIWITANYKETELTHMRAGQDASVWVDTYPDVVFPAKVESLSPGTGLTFSLLPAENATGNWVKVVQRLPVRLRLTKSFADAPLHAGLSVTAEVDTHYRRPLLVKINRILAWITGSWTSQAAPRKASLAAAR